MSSITDILLMFIFIDIGEKSKLLPNDKKTQNNKCQHR